MECKMATIREYRENIDRKLDLLEMEAIALEEDLHHTQEQVIRKYDGLKISLQDTLATLKQKVEKFQSLTEAQRKQLISKIKEVQNHLALGKADTELKIKDQTQKILTQFKMLEQEIDQCLKQKSSEFSEQMLKASDKLTAEFAALEVFFSVQQQKASASFQSNKEKIVHQLQDFNRKLMQNKHSKSQKTAQFEKEFSQGLHKIKNAFLHLAK